MNLNDPSLKEFIDTVHSESDRACAILVGAALESSLEHLLKETLVKATPRQLFEGYGPLSSFSAKIDMSFAIGKISDDERRDIHLLRKIRVEFAHDIDHLLDFDAQKISNRIHELSVIRVLDGFKDTEMNTNRFRFEVAFAILMVLVLHMRLGPTPRLPSPATLATATPSSE